jgi:hypothetical protein
MTQFFDDKGTSMTSRRRLGEREPLIEIAEA